MLSFCPVPFLGFAKPSFMGYKLLYTLGQEKKKTEAHVCSSNFERMVLLSLISTELAIILMVKSFC